MTACELMEEMAFNGRRPRGQEEREKAKMLMESVAEIGCQTPQWGGDRAAMRQGAIERRIPYSLTFLAYFFHQGLKSSVSDATLDGIKDQPNFHSTGSDNEAKVKYRS